MRPWFDACGDDDRLFFVNPTRALLPGLVGDPIRELALQATDAAGMTHFLEALTSSVRTLDHLEGCVFRCAYCEAEELDAQGTLAPWVQCGAVACPTPDGDLLCATHYRTWWLCLWCEALLPDSAPTPEGAFCSPTCAEMAEAELDAQLNEETP